MVRSFYFPRLLTSWGFNWSGFTTISTIGLALFAVGHAMGINPALVAGSIISVRFLVIRCRHYLILPTWPPQLPVVTYLPTLEHDVVHHPIFHRFIYPLLDYWSKR